MNGNELIHKNPELDPKTQKIIGISAKIKSLLEKFGGSKDIPGLLGDLLLEDGSTGVLFYSGTIRSLNEFVVIRERLKSGQKYKAEFRWDGVHPELLDKQTGSIVDPEAKNPLQQIQGFDDSHLKHIEQIVDGYTEAIPQIQYAKEPAFRNLANLIVHGVPHENVLFEDLLYPINRLCAENEVVAEHGQQILGIAVENERKSLALEGAK